MLSIFPLGTFTICTHNYRHHLTMLSNRRCLLFLVSCCDDRDTYGKPPYTSLQPSTSQPLRIPWKDTYDVTVQKGCNINVPRYFSEQKSSINGYKYCLVRWNERTNDYVLERCFVRYQRAINVIGAFRILPVPSHRKVYPYGLNISLHVTYAALILSLQVFRTRVLWHWAVPRLLPILYLSCS